MSRARNPFKPSAVLALLSVGAIAFLLLLYALGQGWTGEGERDGGSHAAANGLNGYSGLVELLRDTGHNVSLSRSPAGFEDYGLQVLTPPSWADPEEINEIIQSRFDNDAGPTLVLLPKWMAMPVPDAPGVEAEEGWVVLAGASSPGWFEQLAVAEGAELAIGETGGWQGLGSSGDLPDESQVQALVAKPDGPMRVLLQDSEGDVLAADLRPDRGDKDYEPWPVIVVFEPDLLNNYGMADEMRARTALALLDEARDGVDMPINFDLTLAGLGASENLLTLAFTPPFLAATLCLLLAGLVIAWRAFCRFGPAIAEAPAMARGKRQLARNGAALVQRVKRWHLLKQPYEDMVGRRVAAALGLRPADHEHREHAIDAALARRGHDGPPFSRLAGDLREANGPRDIIRAARALRTFERTLTQ
ncbi:DUF4350 domain-containing protein [Aurantiacibacter sp. MUD11]|uniref:DUF4350 domain-containing protein n=1 Tax=Aurantiacibacter sp. MUD11 TaxID=3003265 RepID=UPI0022AAD207|nr:DUF4350 domain-containing protein [Aurantiacibacter sp. MUD11]WAT16732.1 DUF4350 domain-containing protein [Aurantiacibacter sp. MUD11]